LRLPLLLPPRRTPPPSIPPPPARDLAMERRTTAFVAAAPVGRFGVSRVGHVTGARGQRGGVLPATRRCRAVVIASAVTQVDHDGLEAALKNDSTTPLLVDFYAPWYVVGLARFASIVWYLIECCIRWWGGACGRGRAAACRSAVLQTASPGLGACSEVPRRRRMARSRIEFEGRHPVSGSGAVSVIAPGGLADWPFRASPLSTAITQTGR